MIEPTIFTPCACMQSDYSERASTFAQALQLEFPTAYNVARHCCTGVYIKLQGA